MPDGLELAPVAALAAASLPIVVVNPQQVRNFARATGKPAKTDAPDAAALARFSNTYSNIVGPVTDTRPHVLTKIHDRYEMHGQTREGSTQSVQVTQEFAARFGVFGPHDYCVQRLAELIELGVERFMTAGTTLDPRHPYAECSERFVAEVVPQLNR